jgi:2-methylisocitrate lyase-like PEP mutase family enzyme
MPTVAEKRRAFRALHAAGCFVLPNPWDVGSARYLQHLGFKALATTSSGAAWSAGKADGGLSLDETLAHFTTLAEASDLPLNADFTNAFADEPEGVAANVGRALATGIAGVSVEDQIHGTKQLYEIDHAVERVRAAREAVDAAGGDATLVARAECYLAGVENPLKVALHRLERFAAAGADCLYAPGVRSADDIRAIVSAVAPKPVNVLVGWPGSPTVAELAALGVRRISVGGALARAAWAGFLAAAREIAGEGRFAALANATPGGELEGFFAADSGRRLS